MAEGGGAGGSLSEGVSLGMGLGSPEPGLGRQPSWASGQGAAQDLGARLRGLLQLGLGPLPGQRFLQFGFKKQSVTWQRKRGSEGHRSPLRGAQGSSRGPQAPSPGQSAVSLKARFLQQPRQRLNTHLLPWTQES